MGRFKVARLELLLVRPPARVSELPYSEKAPAPLLKVRPAKLYPVKSLVLINPAVPAKNR